MGGLANSSVWTFVDMRGRLSAAGFWFFGDINDQIGTRAKAAIRDYQQFSIVCEESSGSEGHLDYPSLCAFYLNHRTDLYEPIKNEAYPGYGIRQPHGDKSKPENHTYDPKCSSYTYD